jgi:hypothetical protein
MLGKIRFVVGVANGVIIIPPRNFVVLSGWHYKEEGVTMCNFQDVFYSISSMQNFNIFRPAIP